MYQDISRILDDPRPQQVKNSRTPRDLEIFMYVSSARVSNLSETCNISNEK